MVCFICSRSVDDSEWVVFDQDDWTYLGYPHEFDSGIEAHVVLSGGFYYTPSTIEIEVGETVEWVNEGGNHDVVFTSGPELFFLPLCTGPCTIGSLTFTLPGTYEYICSIGSHAANGMIGTVVVNAAACDDIDNDNICDDVDDCVGILDECGVCNGTGIADGVCDCDGTLPDCAGECGGTAVVDECGECNGDGLPCLEPEDTFNLFFSEVAEGSSNNKYFEIYNGDVQDVDLNQYSISSCSNGCDNIGVFDYADNVTFETGTIVSAGDVYVVCHGSADDLIQAECDQTFTYLSNGDDVFGLTQVSSGILDVVGTIGEDPGEGWDVAGIEEATKDHTLVRKFSVNSGNPLWLDNPETGETGSAGTNTENSEWVVLGQDMWEYLGFHPHDISSDVMGCMDETACNYNADATVDDGSCASLDCSGECGGSAVLDCANECGGSAVCEVAVTFSVDMSIEGVTGDVSLRTSTENGNYMPSDWFVMDDSDGDMIYTYTMMLETGVEYGYNFSKDVRNNGYESGDGLADCAGGLYYNDRYVTPGDVDIILDTVCFGSCESCPDAVLGCTDSTATNYNAEANIDDNSCEYGAVEYANLFISEVTEGSGNNKYIEIYNASNDIVNLSSYAYPSTSNAPDSPGDYEYWNAFEPDANVAPGDVYVICHPSADDLIQAECDESH